MRHLAKVRNLRLRLEQLEDRLQPSVGLFGDPLAEDPLAGGREDTTSDLQLLASDTEQVERMTAVVQSTTTVPQQVVQTPQAGQPVNEGAALQVVVNAGGGAAVETIKGHTLGSRPVTPVAVAAELSTPASPLVPVDPSNFTITTESCGEETGTQAAVWSQYRGGAGVDVNFRTDATDAGVVYSAGLGADEVAGDNPGSVTRRTGATCNTTLVGTPDANFLLLYGVNVSPGGSSVYTAGFDVFSGIAYVFKLSPDLAMVEAAVMSASPAALNFFFDVVNDAAGNRYIVGMAQNEAGLNGIRVTKLDSNLTLPPTYDVLITFGMGTLNSVGLSLDVDAAGAAYIGGTIVTAATDLDNVTLQLNPAGTAIGWAFGLNYTGAPPAGPNGGMYGVAVQGTSVFTTGILADATFPQDDTQLIARWTAATGTPVVAFGWFLQDGGDLSGYGVDVSSDNSPIVVGSINGPEMDPDVDAFAIKYGPPLNVIVGDDFFGNTMSTDPLMDSNAYGMTLIGSGATADFAVAGDVNHAGFLPILAPCTDEGTFGGIIDGFMLRYAQPLP